MHLYVFLFSEIFLFTSAADDFVCMANIDHGGMVMQIHIRITLIFNNLITNGKGAFICNVLSMDFLCWIKSPVNNDGAYSVITSVAGVRCTTGEQQFFFSNFKPI